VTTGTLTFEIAECLFEPTGKRKTMRYYTHTNVYEDVIGPEDFGFRVATDHDAEGISITYFENAGKDMKDTLILGSDAVAPLLRSIVRVTALAWPGEKAALREVLQELLENL
jgi:hypothetical protein